MIVARIIRKALEILSGKTGIEWIKGEMGQLDIKFENETIESMFELDTSEVAHVGSVCTLGALELAARSLQLTEADYVRAALFVAQFGVDQGVITNIPSWRKSEPVETYDVASFNDASGTTQNDVTDLLRGALAAAEAAPITVTPEPLLVPSCS